MSQVYYYPHKVLDDWSQALFKAGLSSGSVHHLVADVGTFLKWLARRQEISHAPELPTIRIRRADPHIPDPITQGRLFAAIPWEVRGVFLARGQHGLRPSEARRARVSDWNAQPQAIRLRDGSELECHALSVRAVSKPDEIESWEGWIEGPAVDGVRRLRILVRVTGKTVEILDVKDATDWKETR